MKVYIVSVANAYDYNSVITKVFDSEDKAKEFCFNEYGIDYNDWTFSDWNNGKMIRDEHFYYDPEHKKELKTHYTEFKIVIRDIK